MSAGPIVSLRRLRWAARAPRIAVVVVLLLLAAAGLRGVVAPASPPRAAVPTWTPPDLPADGFAVEFARAYLAVDPAAPEARERELARFLADSDLGGDGGAVPSAAGQRVEWAQAIRSVARGRGRLVTVEARMTGRTGEVFLAVPVTRTRAGALAVADYPAEVGGPPTSSAGTTPEREAVADVALAALSRRAIANYLAGDAANLAPDLEPGAAVTRPASRFAVEAVHAVEWATARRDAVRVEVVARDASGGSWTWAYELGVRLRDDRWRVAWIQTLPAAP